jgi:hypothetical protein
MARHPLPRRDAGTILTYCLIVVATIGTVVAPLVLVAIVR